MEYLLKNYSDISSIDKKAIIFKDGDAILFEECIGNRNYSETCVAERDRIASPPYYEFLRPINPQESSIIKEDYFQNM